MQGRRKQYFYVNLIQDQQTAVTAQITRIWVHLIQHSHSLTLRAKFIIYQARLCQAALKDPDCLVKDVTVGYEGYHWY